MSDRKRTPPEETAEPAVLEEDVEVSEGIEADEVPATEDGVSEVILALNATVDGQTTAHYVTDLLAPTGVKVTKLAHGVPVGGELDYLDEGTLAAAIKSRRPF